MSSHRRILVSMPGSRTLRVAAVLAAGVYWAAYQFQAERALERLPYEVREYLMSDLAAAIGFGALLGVGIYVGRWWSLAAAAIPVLPLGLLQLTGHLAPYHEGGRPLEDWQLLVLILATPIAVGVIARTA
jgi:hypothetical protein